MHPATSCLGLAAAAEEHLKATLNLAPWTLDNRTFASRALPETSAGHVRMLSIAFTVRGPGPSDPELVDTSQYQYVRPIGHKVTLAPGSHSRRQGAGVVVEH